MEEEPIEPTNELNMLEHISAQLDVLNHSLYVQNEYLAFIAVSVALIASLLMFITGKLIAKGRW